MRNPLTMGHRVRFASSPSSYSSGGGPSSPTSSPKDPSISRAHHPVLALLSRRSGSSHGQWHSRPHVLARWWWAIAMIPSYLLVHWWKQELFSM
jgi:hypothetical protein